jgi:hypothetical protein
LRSYLEKNPTENRADGTAQGVGPEFKPQHRKKQKTKPDDQCQKPQRAALRQMEQGDIVNNFMSIHLQLR